MDVYAGWYIPNIIQLFHIYSVLGVLKESIEEAGGNIDNFLVYNNLYWSSTPSSSGNMFYTRRYKASYYGAEYRAYDATTMYSIRPVRDFGEEATAYWLDPYLADGTKTSSMEVSPDHTTTYDAVVVFGKDTIPLTGTVLVHETFKSDTLYEVVCQSTEPYNSTKSSLFTNLDISTPTVDYDTFSVNPHTIHGCDSIVTLLLKVVGDCENFYHDSLCPLVTDYYFAPFDTTFEPGTTSGVFEHHGSKTITIGGETTTIDTVAYYDLTIMPEYHIPDELHLCLDEETTVFPYEKNEHVTITVTEGHIALTAETGYGITIDSTDKANGNFVIVMQTDFGCDSLTYLHIDTSVVKRDTIRSTDIFHLNTVECVDRIISKQNGSSYNLPVNNYYYYSCSQQIFTPSEVGAAGPISTISFNYASTTIMSEKTDVKIYMMHTSKNNFTGSSDWVSPSSMTLVYDGELNCTAKGWNEFFLNQTFNYNGSDNLLVMILDESGSYNGSSCTFYYTNTPSSSYKTLSYGSNSYWTTSRSGNRYTYRSDIRFYGCTDEDVYYSTELAGKTFTVTEGGTYTITDTVIGSNGCDSITTRILVVEEPHKDEICDSTFTTDLTWVDNVGPYCWHYNGVDNCIAGKELDSYGYYEFPGKKTIDGVEVDTISYLKLTINPTYRDTNDLRLCLSGNDTTITTYETEKHITIHVSGTGETTVTVPSAYTDVTIETVKAGESMDTIYLRRTTGKGCDSIEVLYLEKTIVQSDTIYMDVLFDSTAISCGDHTIGAQNGNGSQVPLYNYYNYSCTQQIFTHDEMGTLATIEKLSFNYYDATQTSKLNDVYIYLGHTSKSSFSNSSDWISPSAMTLVYHGPMNCHQGWNEFTLTTPFEYNGTDNLILMMNDVSGGGWESYFRFYYTNTADKKSLYYYSDNYTWGISTFTRGSYGILSCRSDIRFYGCSYASTEFDGKTISYKEPGTYIVKDIVPSSNGCDSVVMRVLIVEEPHFDTICETELPTYTWHGTALPASTNADGYYEFPGVKVIDGHNVDTVSYLKLTVNPNPAVSLSSITEACLGGKAATTATVTTTTVENYTYEWSSTEALTFNPASTTSAATSASTEVTLPTDATCGTDLPMSVKLTDGNGCEATANATVTVKTPAKPVITAVNGLADRVFDCNPTVPTMTVDSFSVADECKSDATVKIESVESHDDCAYTKVWVASYENLCGQKADTVRVTYRWTVDETKPVIVLKSGYEADNHNWGCNPMTVTPPAFSVSDNCAGNIDLPTDSIIDGGVVNTSACGRSHTWTAHYTDPCNNKANDVSITYTWTEDNTAPVIHTEAVSDHKGCNPTIVAPTFTVIDNCEGTFVLSADSVTTTGKTGTGCEKSQSWTAHYTDGCGNPAAPLTVTYSWKEDSQKPVIATTATDSYLGCDPTTITPPSFTVSDNCEGDFALPADSVTDGGVVAVTGEPHKFSRTWTAHFTDLCGNKADNVSITYTWVEAPTVTITCPPTVNKTLAYGDCVMNIYPTEIGTPIVNAPSDWPMTVSNNIPADNLYYEGETEITWVATDGICGYSVSCEQKVIVVFPQCPTAVDCEGNVYQSVRIGCDCWTQTNLVSNCYGDANECAISGNCDEPIPCVMEYETPMHPDVDVNVATFGKLYCDTAVLKDSVVNPHGHVQGICPEGWYLPTAAQYDELNLYGADALKSPFYWTDGGGTNTTDFSWLPAGWYNGALQRFEGMLSEGYFWAVEVVHGEVNISAYLIHHDCDSVLRVEAHTGLGYSVRCIKEKE